MAATSTAYLKPVDPQIAAIILSKLNQGGIPRERCLKEAGEQLIEWLALHGRFIQAKTSGELYYLYRDEHRIFRLDSERWKHWLYLVSMVNPASRSFAFLLADCRTAALGGERIEVVKLAHWDGSFLRVSNFDGRVWRLDGQSIEEEANGDGPVLFEDAESWEPADPDLTSDGSSLGWWANLLNVEDPVEEHRIGLLAYVCVMFFTELCPTRPILLLIGEAGSGKSMILRLLLRLLFGSIAELSGVPDKPDGFTAAASRLHLYALDNLDEAERWLRDRLARLTTGSTDQYRVLYSNNEMANIAYRVWVAVTARTPDVLRRDDLADRLLIVPVKRIGDDERKRERLFLEATERERARWWGDLLKLLNQMVADLRAGGLPQASTMRMADFESLGRLAARVQGREDTWDSLVTAWQKDQRDFLLDGSPIVDALEAWLATQANRGREVDSRTLYSECELVLFGASKPDRSWPSSSRSFGRQLATMRRSLQSTFSVKWRECRRRTFYTFDVLP